MQFGEAFTETNAFIHKDESKESLKIMSRVSI